MRKGLRNLIGGVMIHLVVSGTVLAGIRVYQQSYNTIHREHIRMASLTLQSDKAEVSVLGRSCTVPLTLLAEDSMLYYAAYFLTDGTVHLWVYGISEFMSQT